jgi:hypothetical protein
VEPLSKRYVALRKAALSHPAWREQWGAYKPGTFGPFLFFGDARQARLKKLMKQGQQGSYSMSTVLKMTDARWDQVLQQLELQESAPGVQQPQRLEVRRRRQ